MIHRPPAFPLPAAALPVAISLVLACSDGSDHVVIEDPFPDFSPAEGVIDPSDVIEPSVAIRFGHDPDVGPAYQFERISGIDFLPSGDLAVLDAGFSEVRIFSPDGAFLSAFAREGDGPGDLRFPHDLAVRSDTIAILQSGWIKFFDRSGTHLGGVRRDPATGSTFQKLDASGAGWFLHDVRRYDPVERVPLAPYRNSAIFVSRGEESFDRVFDFYREPAGEQIGQTEWTLTPLDAPVPRTAGDPTGGFVFTLGYDVDLIWLDRTGVPTARVRFETPDRVPSDAEAYEALLARQREGVEQALDPEIPRMWREVAEPALRELVQTEFRPAVAGLWVDAGGSAIVRRLDLGGDPFDPVGLGGARVFDWVDREGNHRGRFTLPNGFGGYRLSGNRFWGVLRDEYGVQSVVAYQLVPSPSR